MTLQMILTFIVVVSCFLVIISCVKISKLINLYLDTQLEDIERKINKLEIHVFSVMQPALYGEKKKETNDEHNN